MVETVMKENNGMECNGITIIKENKIKRVEDR